MSKEFSKTSETKVKKKRASAIFTPMSVAHADDDDIHNPSEVHHVEKVFPNGDIYIGQWADSCPNGHGKCLWADGCMYVGEWRKGTSVGKGKFSWPSGATYEGQFKNGYMEGEGIYTGSLNDTYKGTWLCNMRHGKGVQSYDNGDFYEGQWRKGLPEGRGRYRWRYGNEYMGQWGQGKMNGIGTMIWGNGNQYDGNWKDGLPRGNGTFRWVDGSFCIGLWSEDPKEQCGTYYTSSSQKGSFGRDPHEVYSVSLSECRISPVEKIPVLPSQKMVNWPCEGECLRKNLGCKNHKESNPRLRSCLDSASDSGMESGYECLGSDREADGGVGGEDLRGYNRPCLIIRQAKRLQGLAISQGHKNYELMMNLQLGIRHSVGRPSPVTSLDLKATAFDPRDKIWTRFPPEGSKHTPPHHSCEFKWKDYCPLVFRTLRKLFNVDPADYMMSICGTDALRELSSPGKSGSFFYLTSHDKYMIKTMKKSEVKVLKRMLPAYFNHVQSHENTLLTKLFGLHCVKMTGPAQKKVRLVIMGNLFSTKHTIHRRFDLKGSSHGRSTVKPEPEIDSSTTLKDLDLNFIFRLEKSWFNEFSRQLNRDCNFLEQERIMDYSLLVGVHFREISDSGEPVSTKRKVLEPIQSSFWRGASTRLGSNVPARAELVGEPIGECYDVILVFGVIDILQDYDICKKLEHAYKSFQYDAASISAVDPRQYSKRFRDFIFRIFIQDDLRTTT